MQTSKQTDTIHLSKIKKAYEILEADFLEAVNDSDVSLFNPGSGDDHVTRILLVENFVVGQLFETTTQCIVIQLRSVLLFVRH